jgi:hypothetical protein
MGGQVIPAEVVLCLRELLIKIEAIEEQIDGMEAAISDRRGSSSVPERKVSEPEV